jgi:Uri superfamily endonuclease
MGPAMVRAVRIARIGRMIENFIVFGGCLEANDIKSGLNSFGFLETLDSGCYTYVGSPGGSRL